MVSSIVRILLLWFFVLWEQQCHATTHVWRILRELFRCCLLNALKIANLISSIDLLFTIKEISVWCSSVCTNIVSKVGVDLHSILRMEFLLLSGGSHSLQH